MMTHGAAFFAGFVSGWLARSAVSSTRGAMVQGLAVAMRMRDGMRRAVADQVEWWEDMVAEASAKRGEARAAGSNDHAAAAKPIEVVHSTHAAS
jgi:hypothetical protein